IWDPSSGDCLQTLKGHSDYVNAVAFSHDSTLLASVSDDRTFKIWYPSSVDCLQTLESHSSNVNSVAFSHDSTRLVFALKSQTVSLSTSSNSIWIRLDSENLLWLPLEYRPVCFAASGKIIGIGGRTGRVWICKVQLSIS
ncbi:WD40 repeat-like protein, partial [Delitschia confertaspora ATCC 74209]